MGLLKRGFTFVFALTIIFSLTGCETLDDFLKSLKGEQLKAGVHYRLSVHRIVKYPHGLKMEKFIPFYNHLERKLCLNVNYEIDSSCIKDVKITKATEPENIGKYYLNLELDEKGVMSWMQISNGFYEQSLALVCDGKVLDVFKVKVRSDEKTKTVRLPEPVPFNYAQLIKKYAKHNYKFYNF
jgi:hypothetical protein